jgi:tRNA 2-thiouridine synthesizing protein A
MTEVKEDLTLDTRGLGCPMPILKLKKTFDGLRSGQVLKMLASDPGSVADVKAWAEKTGHSLLSFGQEGAIFVFFLRKS